MNSRWLCTFCLYVLIMVLTGCGGPRNVAVPIDNYTQRAYEVPERYTVRSGDSLYMIAMEFDLDHLDVAGWNHISAPYVIHRGQVLRLRPPAKQRTPVIRKCDGTFYTVMRGDSLGEIAARCGVQLHQLAQWNRLSPPYTIQVGQRLRLAAPAKAGHATKMAKAARQPRTATRDRASKGGISRLKRPAGGTVVKRFSSKKGVTGMEFSGKKGDPVRAAGDGKVVYSGTGLVRYGKLLIISHDGNLLTAYAHNSDLQVTEGVLVKAGQQIAKMGSSGTDRVKLHFEVRKGGKPVNPMLYLEK